VKRLEDLSLTQRVLLAISITVAVLLALLIISRVVGEGAQAQPSPREQSKSMPEWTPITDADMCVDEDERERVRTLLSQALDEALKHQIERLFEIWVRDFKVYKEGLAPARQGARNAIIAYSRSRASLEKWNPHSCPEAPK
jgi:hypothetical protein